MFISTCYGSLRMKRHKLYLFCFLYTYYNVIQNYENLALVQWQSNRLQIDTSPVQIRVSPIKHVFG